MGKVQQEGESAETYITKLYRLAETCDYGNMKEELLRDHLVVKIRDMKLSEKLQMDADLTLERAKPKGSSTAAKSNPARLW